MGRPIGARNRASLILEDMLDAHGEDLADAFVQAARKGNVDMLKCYAHLVLAPAKQRQRRPLDIGELRSLADALQAQRQVTAALARGEIDDDQAAALEQQIAAFAKLFEQSELASRLERIEARLKQTELHAT